MQFKLDEFEFKQPTRVGDVVEYIGYIGKVGPFPEKVRKVLERCISETQDFPEKVRKVLLCRAVFGDGRTYWTVTCFSMTRKKILIERTSVWSAEGKQVFSAKAGPSRALHGMEGKRMDKILRSVMSS